MKPSILAVASLTLCLALNGCGGSSSGSGSPVESGGLPLQQFSANLPDGSPMEIEILDNKAGQWAGEFAVAAETGPYAHQVGSFEGTVAGNTLTATCEASDGTEFTLSGTANADKSLSITRSDIPGTVLKFQPVAAPALSTRADASANYSTGSSSGRMTMSTSAYSIQAGGTMVEYRGKWMGLDVTYWSYSSGYGTIVTYVDPFCINTANFLSLKIADFGSATKPSNSCQVVMYSSVIRAQVKFPSSVTLSP